MRGFSLACLSLAAVLLALAGCGNQGAQREPLVGVFLSLSGPTADFGITTRNGIELAVEEINRGGGLNGTPMKILVEDTRGKSDESRTAVTKLIEQNRVIALLGEVASSNSLAAAPVAQARKVPMITPSSTNPQVTAQGDFIFRVCFIDPFQGYVMAKFARENLKAQTAAILWDNSQDYSKGLAEVFKREFPRMGGRIVQDVTYASSDVDFSSQLTRIRSARPDVIYIPGYYSEVSLIARKARELGITVPLLGSDGWTSPTLLERAGGALEGCYYSDHYSLESDKPVVRKFVESFRQKYGHDPNSLAALGYDATWILADAIKRAGSFDPVKMRDAIAGTKDFPGVTGKITINEERNAVKSAVVLQIKDNKISYFTTIDP